MIIILEGPDGGGKTFLARELEKQLGFRYHHEHNEPTLDSPGLLKRYLSLPQDNTVYDRMAVSELVYSMAMDRECRLTAEEVKLVMMALKQCAPVVTVLCQPPLEVCIQALEERGDYLVNVPILTRVWWEYYRLGKDLRQWDFYYDRTLDGAVEDFIEAIERFRKVHQK